MAFSLKTWVNRISEYPNRRKLTHEDGSTELVTVARAEGQISAEGNAFSAEEMNDLENRIKVGFDEVNQSLTNLIPVKVWENSLPSSSFSSQEITLNKNMTNYKYIEIIYKISTASQALKSTGRIPLIQDTCPILSHSEDYIYNRKIKTMHDNKIVFDNCIYKSSLGNSGESIMQNLVCIPLQVLLY